MKTTLALLIFLGFLLPSCTSNTPVEKYQPPILTPFDNVAPVSEADLSGAQLANAYCIGCHLFPKPELLDKKTWEDYILNRMGHYYGIYETADIRKGIIEGGRAGQFVERANLFPKQPSLDTAIFNKIRAYYLVEAPEALPQAPQPSIKMGLKNFNVVLPSYRANNPMTSLVKIVAPNKIYVSDVGTSSLSILDGQFKVQRNAPTREGVSWIYETSDVSLALVMGTFNPTDMNIGYLMTLPQNRGGDARILVSDLQRPVHFDVGDLDGDGNDDFVICEYGKHTGSLSWWQQDNSGTYRRKILRNKPGATKAYIRDLNNDGKLDIIALFGQGEEGVFIYHNQGNGNFIEEKVLAFPPSYGSSYFELVDFDGNGLLDILYTAGDNADYDPILKRYHGIRLFANDGSNHFSETLFYPLNGAYKAIAHDFDADGDLDIAAISFFPDYEDSPQESFVYLENKGDIQFEASTFAESASGRWIAMDLGDVDGDGDMDLMLGSMIFGTDFTDYFDKWAKNGVPYLILENTAK
nr:VCBS repeat-containing protein [Cytophagales bacterium]